MRFDANIAASGTISAPFGAFNSLTVSGEPVSTGTGGGAGLDPAQDQTITGNWDFQSGLTKNGVNVATEDDLVGFDPGTNAAISGTIVRPLGLAHNPIALYKFEGDLLDSSGNGYTLTVENGTENIVRLGPFLQGHAFDTGTLLVAADNAAFELTGDLTLQVIATFATDAVVADTKALAGQTGVQGDGNDAENFLYRMGLDNSDKLAYFAEQAGGTNINFASTSAISGRSRTLHHIAMVRESNDVTFYVDGVASAASSGLNAPVGGTSTRFRIGGDIGGGGGDNFYNGVIASVKLVGSALSSDQIRREYDSTLATAVIPEEFTTISGAFTQSLTVSGVPVDITGGGGGGSALTVEEQDGNPSVSNVITIKVTNATLTDEGAGVVSIDTGGSGGGGSGGSGLGQVSSSGTVWEPMLPPASGTIYNDEFVQDIPATGTGGTGWTVWDEGGNLESTDTDEIGLRLKLTSLAASTIEFTGLYKEVPVDDTWEAWTHLNFVGGGNPSHLRNTYLGLGLFEDVNGAPSTTNFIFIGMHQFGDGVSTTSFRVERSVFSQWNNSSPTAVVHDFDDDGYHPNLFVRVVKRAANPDLGWDMFYSFDGRGWQAFDFLNAPFETPHIGLIASNGTTTAGSRFGFSFYRTTDLGTSGRLLPMGGNFIDPTGGGGGGTSDPLVLASGVFSESLTISGVPVSTGTGGGGSSSIDDINGISTGSVTITGAGDISTTTVGNIITVSGVDLGFESGVVFVREITLDSDAASIDFENLPQEAVNLTIMTNLRSAEVDLSDPVKIRFNDDAGTNYDSSWRGFYADNVSTGSATDGPGLAFIRALSMPGATAPADYAGTATYHIPQYSQTTFVKSIHGTGFFSRGTSANNTRTEIVGGQWRDTSAITKISFFAFSGDNLAAGSKITVYGMGNTTATFTENIVASSGTFSQHLTISGVPVSIGGGGSASSLQDAYDNDTGIITTVAGKPFHVIGDEYDGQVDFQVTGSGKFTESLQVGSGTVFIHGDLIETPALSVGGTRVIPSQTATTISGVIARNLSSEHSPVGLWHFDQSLADASGNGLDLSVINGTEAYSNANGVQGFKFTGDDTLGHVSTAALEITGDVTIEILFSSDDISTEREIISYANQTVDSEPTNFLYAVRVRAGGGLRYDAEFGAGTNVSYTIDDGPQLGTLNHITLVRESADVTFYLNGYKVGASSSGLTAPTGGTTAFLNIGLQDTFGDELEGIICGLKIIPSALTAAQVYEEYEQTQQLSPLTTLTDTTVSGIIGKKLGTTHDPVALYLFDDTLSDSSGNGLDLTMNTGNERYVSVNGLRALKLSGAASARHNVTGTALEITGDVTVQALLLKDNQSSIGYAVSYAVSGDAESGNVLYALRYLASSEQLSWFQEHSAGTDQSFATSAAGISALHLITGVRSGATITIYVDGVEVGSTTLTVPTGGTLSKLNIGDFDGGSELSGAMACVKIIDSALTAAQVYEEFRSLWADAPSSVGGGGSSVDETQVALISQVFGS